MKTKKATIKSINEVRSNGEVLVSLCNMSADLTDCIRIDTSQIKDWFGVDANGYSVCYAIRPGQRIEYDELFTVTRRLSNVRFIQND